MLTVLACDPGSSAPTEGWDRRAGFATEGEAARARREEDARACRLLGAHPVWLPFGSVDFERHGDEEEVAAAVGAELDGADVALFPGFPLTHPDHEWLARLLLGRRFGCARYALYAEQPYTSRARAEPRVPTWLEEAAGARFVLAHAPVGLGDRVRKWRALGAYRTQLPLLGMRRSLRRGRHVLALQPELVAWPDGGGRARD